MEMKTNWISKIVVNNLTQPGFSHLVPKARQNQLAKKDCAIAQIHTELNSKDNANARTQHKQDAGDKRQV